MQLFHRPALGRFHQAGLIVPFRPFHAQRIKLFLRQGKKLIGGRNLFNLFFRGKQAVKNAAHVIVQLHVQAALGRFVDIEQPGLEAFKCSHEFR